MWRAKVGSQSDKHTKDKHNISLCLLLKQKLNIFFVQLPCSYLPSGFLRGNYDHLILKTG